MSSPALLMLSALTPLLVLLHCIAVAQEPIRVTGLKEGESFVELAPGREPVEEFDSFYDKPQVLYFRGRVVDAISRKPVAGAMIETWTEELNPITGGFQRMGEAISGSDGRFRVRHGEKARIQAAGYLTWSEAGGGLWDDGILLYPADSTVPCLRVIDTTGKPIFNAVVTSSYSCSHDVPAFEARSDSQGIVRLPGYGVQENIQDLRLRAGGYAGTEYLWCDPAFISEEPFTVVMPRQERNIDLQILGRDGVAITNGTLHITDGDCYHTGMTSNNGRIRFPYRFLAENILIRPIEEIDGFQHIASLEMIPDRQVKLRLDSSDWRDEESIGTISIELPPEEVFEVHGAFAQLFHEDGWSDWLNTKQIREGTIEFPTGKAFLHIGGGFFPYSEEWIEFEVVEGEQVALTPEWKVQPSFRLTPHEGFRPTWVEADGLSREIHDAEEPIFYPEGSRVVVCQDSVERPRFWDFKIPRVRLMFGKGMNSTSFPRGLRRTTSLTMKSSFILIRR